MRVWRVNKDMGGGWDGGEIEMGWGIEGNRSGLGERLEIKIWRGNQYSMQGEETERKQEGLRDGGKSRLGGEMKRHTGGEGKSRQDEGMEGKSIKIG